MTTWQFKPAPRRPETRLTWFQSWMLSRGCSRFESVQGNRILWPGRVIRNTVGVAARRSGKTAGSRALVWTAGNDPGPGDIGYMAPTLGQAKRLLWRPLMQDLKDPAAMALIQGKANHSELTLEFKSGTRLYLYSAEAYERVRGDGFKLFLTDETDDPLYHDAIFDEAIYPALSDNKGSLVQLGTPKGRGRLYKEFCKGDKNHASYDPECDSIQVTAMEAGIIDKSEIERARRTRPKRAFDQEYRATFNAAIGLVYDEFDRAVHVKNGAPPPLDHFSEIIVGVDWGIINRGVMLVAGIDYVDVESTDEYEAESMPRIWLLDEYSYSQRPYSYSTDPERPGWWTIAQRIQREYGPTRWYCDPSGGTADETEAKSAGYLNQLQEALSQVDRRAKVIGADNSISHGISAVSSFIHHSPQFGEPPRFFVMGSRCPDVIGELEAYRWQSARNAEDEFEERPVKKDDHCFVAGTMVATDRGEVPIEQIVVGDMVLTRSGYYPVKVTGMTQRSAQVWRLEFDGGHLDGTQSHLVWTVESGWIRLDAIRYGDTLVSCQNERIQVQRQSNSTGDDTIDTQTHRASNCAATTEDTGASDCIEQSGSSTTAQSLTDTISTTKTATRSTTISAISSVCQPANTPQNTSLQNGPQGHASTLTRSDRSPKPGAQAQKDWLGIVSTARTSSATASPTGGTAICAGKNTKRPTGPDAPSSAGPIAEQPTDGAPALTILTGSAPSAVQRFVSTDTVASKHVGVLAVRAYPLGIVAPVYDLTVNGPPEFFANGVLVHNCMDALRYLTQGHFYSKRKRSGRNDAGFDGRQ